MLCCLAATRRGARGSAPLRVAAKQTRTCVRQLPLGAGVAGASIAVSFTPLNSSLFFGLLSRSHVLRVVSLATSTLPSFSTFSSTERHCWIASVTYFETSGAGGG